jgi:hypothetical protein
MLLCLLRYGVPFPKHGHGIMSGVKRSAWSLADGTRCLRQSQLQLHKSTESFACTQVYGLIRLQRHGVFIVVIVWIRARMSITTR